MGKLLNRINEPAIFGLSGTMSPNDPYPALRDGFDRMLKEVELLVGIGFSFWDAHISAPIRRWPALDERRQITIVGPNFHTSTTAIWVLVDALCSECTIEGKPTMAAGSGIDRMRVLRVVAAEGIATIFAP